MNKSILNIQWILNKLRPFIDDNQELRQRIINCLFFYKHLEQESKQSKWDQVLKQKQRFKKFYDKMEEYLSQIARTKEGSAIEQVNIIKDKIENRRKEIENKLDSFNRKNAPVQEPSTVTVKKPSLVEDKNRDEERFTEQMEPIVQEMKNQGKDTERNLQEGNLILKNALGAQEELYQQLDKVMKKVDSMLKSSSMSWWELGIMSIISLLLFLFTAAFIIAF